MNIYNRNISADLLKGLGILVMMIGHMPFSEGMVRHVIYSFHMPLFFLVAGYFFNEKISVRSVACGGLKRLILPYLFVQFLLVLWGGVMWLAKNDSMMFYRFLCEFVWSSEGVWHAQWGNIQTGAVWFLLALFWARLFYCIIAKYCKYSFIVCCVISVMVCMLYQQFKFLSFVPTFILQGLSALIFLACGHKYKQLKFNFKPYMVFIEILLWYISVYACTIDMYSCYYVMYPLAIVGACSGTLVLYRMLQLLAKKCEEVNYRSPLLHCLKWMGMNSLLILLVHHFERWSCCSWNIKSHLPIFLDGVYFQIFQIFITLVTAVIIYQLKMMFINSRVVINKYDQTPH